MTFKNSTSRIFLLVAGFACLTLTSCSTLTSNEIHEDGLVINDPFEEQNRRVMAFNKAVDGAFVEPLVHGYRAVAPKPARTGIRNFLRNLRSPVNFVNQLLQGDIEGAGTVLVRTAINSTLGLGGLVDLAGHEGIEYESEDFGQTLAVWGVDAGPYLVVPFIGPSSARDYVGYAVDSFADPVRWYGANTDRDGIYYAKLGADYLDIRESLMDTLKELEVSSIDHYAAVRSTYYQHREAAIKDQKKSEVDTDLPDIPDFYD